MCFLVKIEWPIFDTIKEKWKFLAGEHSDNPIDTKRLVRIELPIQLIDLDISQKNIQCWATGSYSNLKTWPDGWDYNMLKHPWFKDAQNGEYRRRIKVNINMYIYIYIYIHIYIHIYIYVDDLVAKVDDHVQACWTSANSCGGCTVLVATAFFEKYHIIPYHCYPTVCFIATLW